MREATKEPRKTSYDTIRRAQVKALRADARKLETVAKHLRGQAAQLVNEMKSEKRAEQARTAFFSKKPTAMPEVSVDLNPPKDDPLAGRVIGAAPGIVPLFMEEKDAQSIQSHQWKVPDLQSPVRVGPATQTERGVLPLLRTGTGSDFPSVAGEREYPAPEDRAETQHQIHVER